MVVFFPIGGDEEDLLVYYDLTIVDFVPSNWLRKPILDTDVPGVLEGLGSWDYSLENYRDAAGPLWIEEISCRGAVPL